MKKIIAFGFSAMLLFSACSSDIKDTVDNVPVPQSGLQYMEFTASAGTDTRTQLTSDNKVVWQAGDEISIFDGAGNHKFNTKDSGTSAVFGGNAASASTYYALYPYQEGAILAGNVIKNVTLPSEQTAKAGSFDAAYNLSVATASSDLQLAFKNVVTLVKFSVSNSQAASEVRKVKLTSHDATAVLTGTVDITLGSQPAATPASGQQPYATLIADNGLEAGQYYYFAVLPSVLNAGFSLTFYDEQGSSWQKDFTKKANLNRSNILKLAAIEIGTFTDVLLTNANLIAAAEESTERTFTKNADGTVSLSNDDNYQIAMAVTKIDVNEKEDPTVCDEIGVFSNLKRLDCTYNGITSLDLTKNTKLTILNCAHNQLTSLDLSNNTALTQLECGVNQLTTLDLSNHTALTNLYCSNNQLTALDLSNNTALQRLGCHYNKLTNLDLSNNTVLTHLVCGGNRLTTLDLSMNTGLTVLGCNRNQLTSLDFTNNTALSKLDCTVNQLTNLDISNNNQIDCSTLKVGSQRNDQTLTLYVNADQNTFADTILENNENVNVLLKSDATHKGFNEIDY